MSIFIMNADGTGATTLTATGPDLSPDWSPDGSYILFKSVRDGNQQLYKIKADGSGTAERLTNNNFIDSMQAWSPVE